MVARRITQETFDATVQENIDEFEMDREEAIADAISQFESQAVDLSNVETSGRADRKKEQEDLMESLATLERAATACRGVSCSSSGADDAASEEAAAPTKAAVLSALEIMGDACGTDRSRKVTINRALIGSRKGGHWVATLILHACIVADDVEGAVFDCALANAAMSALLASLSGYAENRDLFKIEGGLRAVSAVLQRFASASEVSADERVVVQRALLLVGAACKGAENNKSAFMNESRGGRTQGGELLVGLLRRAMTPTPPSGELDQATAYALCVALRHVGTADDLRKDFSSAYDSARALVDAGAVDVLLKAADAFSSDLGTLGAVLEALRTVAKNDDAVKMIAKGNGITMCAKVLETYPDDAAACRHAASLLRNMSASDNSKDVMCSNGTLELLLASAKRHSDDAQLQEHFCATIANMALRRPQNAVKIVGLGGGNLVITSMHAHAEQHANLQRQGCLALRNIVARSPELREPIIDGGAETVLRSAAKLSQVNVDMAYAALRDLGIDVKIVTFTPSAVAPTGGSVDEDTELQTGVALFGASKPNFNPVFDETNELSEAIADKAHAPSEDMRF